MSQNVTKLKELLFDRENATLTELQARIAEVAASEQAGRLELSQSLAKALETSLATEAANREQLAAHVESLLKRAGTEEQFRTSVADVLHGAVREAEAKHHEPLARAVAPLVVKTIKTELRNSQDEMVEALYPITGRMVKAYIASAMKDLVDQINRRLSGGSNPVMLRLRSLMTGRSVAELALAETQRLEVVELFLVRRGSGELVQHWPDGPQGAGIPSNSDIHLSGVLTAINDFAAQALKDDGGNLRSFSLDDFQMYLRGSPVYLLAAKCRGAAPAGVEAALDDEFLRLIERNGKLLSSGGETPPPLLPPLAKNLESRLAEMQRTIASEAGLGFNPLKALAVLVGLPLMLYAGWITYTAFEVAQVQQFANRTIAGIPQLVGYPTQLEVGARGRDVTLTGLVPTLDAKAEVIKRLHDGLPTVTVIDRLTVLPNRIGELEPQITSVRRTLAGIEGEALRASVRRGLTRSVRRLDQTMPHLAQLEQTLTDRSARTVAQAVRTNVERDLGALRALQARIAGPVDITQLNALAAPMHTIAEQLRQSSVRISRLLVGGAGANDVAHADAAPVDVLESAETLSLSAEQLATVVVAVGQSAGIKPPPVVVIEPSARELLDKWTRTNAIFFSDGVDYRNAESALSSIDALAALMMRGKTLVRVVGYTDERGTAGRNVSLSQTRAQRVVDALIERGVPRQLLVAVGRISGGEISAAVGPQSNNRRVEFELGFEGEASDQP